MGVQSRFILGIYDELLASISGFFSRNWKKHIGFLLPLAIGIGATILLFSRVIEFLLKNYHAQTQFFFLGLIIGVLPFIARQANVKKNFKIRHFLVILIVGAALASLAFINPIDSTTNYKANGIKRARTYSLQDGLEAWRCCCRVLVDPLFYYC